MPTSSFKRSFALLNFSMIILFFLSGCKKDTAELKNPSSSTPQLHNLDELEMNPAQFGYRLVGALELLNSPASKGFGKNKISREQFISYLTRKFIVYINDKTQYFFIKMRPIVNGRLSSNLLVGTEFTIASLNCICSATVTPVDAYETINDTCDCSENTSDQGIIWTDILGVGEFSNVNGCVTADGKNYIGAKTGHFKIKEGDMAQTYEDNLKDLIDTYMPDSWLGY
jgi:hypothetical protein